MVVFALLIVPFLGALFAFSGQRAFVDSDAGPFEAPFFRGLFHVIAFYIPVLAYLYTAYPGWSLAYMVEPLRLPPLFGLALASLSFSGYFFFYLGTRTLIRSGHRPMAWLAAAQPLLAAFVFVGVFRDELFHKGSYHEFHTGTAARLSWSNGLLEATVGVLLLLVPAGVLMVRNLVPRRAPTTFEV